MSAVGSLEFSAGCHPCGRALERWVCVETLVVEGSFWLEGQGGRP